MAASKGRMKAFPRFNSLTFQIIELGKSEIYAYIYIKI